MKKAVENCKNETLTEVELDKNRASSETDGDGITS